MQLKKFFTPQNVAYLAVLTALVVVLQFFGGTIKITPATSLSFVLLPIVLGAVLLGPFAGAFLGGVFGLITYLFGVTGADFFTSVLFQSHPFLTALVCFGKGICAGLAAGFVYRLVNKKNAYVALFLAAAATPIVNTGLFLLGMIPMAETLTLNFVEEGSTLVYFLFIGCAGINFLIELAINLVVAPALSRVVQVVEKQLTKKKKKTEEES